MSMTKLYQIKILATTVDTNGNSNYFSGLINQVITVQSVIDKNDVEHYKYCEGVYIAKDKVELIEEAKFPTQEVVKEFPDREYSPYKLKEPEFEYIITSVDQHSINDGWYRLLLQLNIGGIYATTSYIKKEELLSLFSHKLTEGQILEINQ